MAIPVKVSTLSAADAPVTAAPGAVTIMVNGHNVEVPEHFRVHVAEKMAHLQRYDDKIIRYDVELFHENNHRKSKLCQRVEITGTGKCITATEPPPRSPRPPGRSGRAHEMEVTT